jgi:hypothetical protein
VLLAVVAAAASAWAGVAYTVERHSGVPAGEGVGMYTDPSVANQASTFTINRTLVSCGVGTVDAGGFIGPFEMLMYSTRITSYDVDCARKEITARGTMRSLTRVGGVIVEDERHAFIAHALDLDGDEEPPRRDRFEVHFKTTFWQPGNPFCTPSDRYPGLCKFGGRLFLGDVNVSCGDDEECPDDDKDNDGLTDSRELSLATLLDNPDSDLDGVKDGNDDANGNGEDDEDEDDDDDECPNDSDDDGVDDEDEDDDEDDD